MRKGKAYTIIFKFPVTKYIKIIANKISLLSYTFLKIM